MADKLWLFTTHFHPNDSSIKRAILARNPTEAASLLGGTYIERKGGVCDQSTDPKELGLCGTIKFPFEVFHRMDSEDEYLAGIFIGDNTHCHYESGLLTRGKEDRELVLRMIEIRVPDYIHA